MPLEIASISAEKNRLSTKDVLTIFKNAQGYATEIPHRPATSLHLVNGATHPKLRPEEKPDGGNWQWKASGPMPSREQPLIHKHAQEYRVDNYKTDSRSKKKIRPVGRSDYTRTVYKIHRDCLDADLEPYQDLILYHYVGKHDPVMIIHNKCTQFK